MNVSDESKNICQISLAFDLRSRSDYQVNAFQSTSSLPIQSVQLHTCKTSWERSQTILPPSKTLQNTLNFLENFTKLLWIISNGYNSVFVLTRKVVRTGRLFFVRAIFYWLDLRGWFPCKWSKERNQRANIPGRLIFSGQTFKLNVSIVPLPNFEI